MKDFERAEYGSRWGRTRDAMRAAGIDGLLVTAASNYRYLSGHHSVQFSIGRRPTLLMLAQDSDPVVIVAASEAPAASEQTWIDDVRDYAGLSIEASALADALSGVGLSDARIGLELGPWQRLGASWELLQETRRALGRADFVDSTRLMARVRSLKSVAEIARIERAGDIASRAMSFIFARARPGMTVEACGQMAVSAMIEAGADVDPPPIASFGSHPAGFVYRTGDVLQADIAPSHRGYRADMTRRAVFGRADESTRRDHSDVCELLAGVLRSLRTGATAADVGRAFVRESQLRGRSGLGAGEWIGHGIGLDLLEPPSLDTGDETLLEAGMVVTPEPWFRAAGDFVMVEETVLMTDAGSRILTRPAAPENMAVIEG